MKLTQLTTMLTVILMATLASAQTDTTFTYQGELNENGFSRYMAKQAEREGLAFLEVPPFQASRAISSAMFSCRELLPKARARSRSTIRSIQRTSI